MVSVLGCGGGSLPPQSDPDEARKLLIVALEAWKGGETANTLAARQPPLYFNDLIADHRLISYTIADGHEMYGLSVRLRATLSLKLPDGSTKERKVTYLVDTAPVLVIVQG
jgi:hypothetical protein